MDDVNGLDKNALSEGGRNEGEIEGGRGHMNPSMNDLLTALAR